MSLTHKYALKEQIVKRLFNVAVKISKWRRHMRLSKTRVQKKRLLLFSVFSSLIDTVRQEGGREGGGSFLVY